MSKTKLFEFDVVMWPGDLCHSHISTFKLEHFVFKFILIDIDET